MLIPTGVSNRHVHLTEETFNKLFPNQTIENVKDLNQPGEFASSSKLTLKGPKGEIENVRVLGPFRSYNQVEISKTDSFKLGVNPPVRNSGDTEDSESITLVNGDINVVLDEGCIIPVRHIHMTFDQAEVNGFKNGQIVKVKVNTEKGGILDNVVVRPSKRAFLELHIDTDDGNGFLITNGTLVEVIK